MFGTGELAPELRARLDRELEKGERVVWAGQPLARAYARGAWGMAVFGVFFGGFALVWTALAATGAWAGVQKGGAGWWAVLFPLWGLPFIAVGFAMLTAPYWARRRAARVVYAVTDRRALVLAPVAMRGESVRSFVPRQLQSLERIERRDGSGDLVFANDLHVSGDGDGGTRNGVRQVGFTGVADVRGVEGVVRRLAESDGAPL